MQGFTVPEMNARLGEGLPVHARFLTVCILHELRLLNKSSEAPAFMPGFAGLTGSGSGFRENRVAISPNGRAARWLRHFYGRKLTKAAAEAAFSATFQPDILWERESSRRNVFETLEHEAGSADSPYVYGVSFDFISEYFGRYSDSQGIEKMLGWPEGFADKFFGNSYWGLLPEGSRKELSAGDRCPHCGGILADENGGVLACPDCGVKLFCGVSFEETGPKADDLPHRPESLPKIAASIGRGALEPSSAAFAPGKTGPVRLLAACILVEMLMKGSEAADTPFPGLPGEERRAELYPDGFAGMALKALCGRRLTKALVLSASQAVLQAGPISLKLFDGVIKPFDRRDMERYQNGLAFAADEVTPWQLSPALGGSALLDGTLKLGADTIALGSGKPDDALARIAATAFGIAPQEARRALAPGFLRSWDQGGDDDLILLIRERCAAF